MRDKSLPLRAQGAFWLTLILLLGMVVIELVGVGYGASNTRKRITEEFNMFIRSPFFYCLGIWYEKCFLSFFTFIV